MTRPHIDELVRVLNRSFDDSSHSLLANLATVTEQEWEASPYGGQRRTTPACYTPSTTAGDGEHGG